MKSFDKYEEVESFQSQNILDTLLNKYMFGNHILIWKNGSWAINQIQKLCLGFTIKRRHIRKLGKDFGLKIWRGSVVSLSSINDH